MHLEKMAAERNLICAQLGVEIRSLENFLININEDNVNLSNLYSMMRKTYGKKKIPICPYTDRRLTEDIPCGIVPLAILAKTFFIDTPAINETISIGNELALDYDKNHIDYKQNELFEHYTRIIPQIIG